MNDRVKKNVLKMAFSSLAIVELGLIYAATVVA